MIPVQFPSPRTMLLLTAGFIFLVSLAGIRPPWVGSGSFINLGMVVLTLAFLASTERDND